MYAKKYLCYLCCLGFWLCAKSHSEAQQTAKEPSPASSVETYSLRIENVLYGRIEISLDRGAHTILIGRVLRPAVQMTIDKTAVMPGVTVRAQGEGVTFAVATGRVLKLAPAFVPGKPIRSGKKMIPAPGPGPAVIVTDMLRGKGLFAALLPPATTPVHVITAPLHEAAFPADYSPALDDIFVFHVHLPLPAATNGQTDTQREEALREAVRVQVTGLQKEYAIGAVARVHNDPKRKIVSGTLTLRSTLPEGEPDPITAVTYTVDGRFIAGQDTAPFVYRWNTLNVEDGEHVLEIRGENHNNRLITRTRVLVVVQNAPASPPTSAASTPANPPSSP